MVDTAVVGDVGEDTLTYARIENEKTEFALVNARMDKDEKLYYLDPFIFRTFGGQPVPKIINMTLPDPALFAHRAIGLLQNAAPTIDIQSDELTDAQQLKIEEIVEALLLTVDEKLGIRGLTGMWGYYQEQACIRGGLNGECLIRPDPDSEYALIDIRPNDRRFVTYSMGMNGLNWYAYHSRKSKAYIKDKWDIDMPSGELHRVVTEAYSKTHYQVWVGEGDAATASNAARQINMRNPYGYVPAITQLVPAGSSLGSWDAIPHHGESIFQLNRNLYPEMNRLATVLHNLTMASFFGARQYVSEAGEQGNVEAIPFGLGVVVAIEKGGGYTMIPVNDIRNATRLEYAMLESRLQRGSFANIEYGNLSFPLSAVAIGRLTEAKDLIFVPRLQADAMFYQRLIHMAFAQLIQVGRPFLLGQPGREKEYKPSDLAGRYTVRFRYFAESREQRMASLTEAQSAGSLYSEQFKREELLHIRDPKKMERQVRYEQAGQDPRIYLLRQAHALVDLEEHDEAELTLVALEDMLRQQALNKAIMTSPTRPAGGESQPQLGPGQLMPLLGADGGGGGGGRRGGKTEEQEVEAQINEEDRIARLAETARVGRKSEA